MVAPAWLWIVFTVIGAAAQTARTAMQRELIETLGTIGATHVRFLFGLPFSLLFLALIAIVSPDPLPAPNATALAWIGGGALSQVAATALMLAAMRERSFIVTTALAKVEPVWVAFASAAFLHEPLTAPMMATIAVATLGVLLMSWPRASHGGRAPSLQSALLGLGAGALFGFAAIGYRGGIGALGGPSFLTAATVALAIALAFQTAVLSAYLAVRDRQTLVAIARAWRPSLFAGFMGALASQFWFLAFALQSAALVRTVALVEILFALFVSRRIFDQRLGGREALGILLLVAGVAALLNTV
ncbi:EamA family transporter [Hyphomicrobium sp. CS1GBMeth3]|uniref:EamA family transporter n=1 Tax=Hyphomicrobium sp. CS1GBMeth3 TaxID=1892845 RepID=UPI000930F4CE|nr:EamA family transporter [Hyphomicrobium sp. CS1GBMeth3]